MSLVGPDAAQPHRECADPHARVEEEEHSEESIRVVAEKPKAAAEPTPIAGRQQSKAETKPKNMPCLQSMPVAKQRPPEPPAPMTKPKASSWNGGDVRRVRPNEPANSPTHAQRKQKERGYGGGFVGLHGNLWLILTGMPGCFLAASLV